MALDAVVENYFKTMNPIAAKVYEDIEDAKMAYENIWDTLTNKEKTEIINESIIKPEVTIKYSLLDNFEFDINNPPVRKDDLMSFFGRDHGQRIVQDDNTSWRDEHSAPFIFQTKSQLNLCVLSEYRDKKNLDTGSPPPVMSELAMTHSKVVSELKNALKSHDKLKSTVYKEKVEAIEREPVMSPTGFLSKLIGNKFNKKDDDKERLVLNTPIPTVASSDNLFRTNFRSPSSDNKMHKDYCGSDLSEENRGLLSSISQGSSEFHSCEELEQKTESTETLTTSLPKTGYDFLDNW